MLVLVLVSVIMVAGGIWEMQNVRHLVTEEIHGQANRSMQSATNDIDYHMMNVETAVNTAASYANLFIEHEDSLQMLMNRLIASNEDITAVTLLYEAHHFPEHGRYYAPTITRNPLTQELERDEIGGPENDFCYLETDSNWIYTNERDSAYWCLPYLDTISTHRPMICYSVPVHDKKDKLVAVLCADVDLRWISKVANNAKPYDFSEVYILSRDSHYICHPDSNAVLMKDALMMEREENDLEGLKMTYEMLKGMKGCDTVSHSIFRVNPNEGDGLLKNLESIVFYAPVKRVQWSVSLAIPLEKIMEMPNRLRSQMLIFLGIMLFLIAIALYFVIRHQMRPIQTLAVSAKEVAKGNFHAPLPALKFRDEIFQLRTSFSKMQSSLAAYIEELKITTATKASFESELKVAHDIQMGMIPKTMPPFPDRTDVDLHAILKPAKDVGGDLYDFHIRDEKLFFCIGDVSGKGIPAALFMSMTRSLFRNITMNTSRPSDIMTTLNRSLADGNEYNMFCTMFLGVLDLQTGELTYCNAGHNAPALINGSNCELMTTEVNVPLGVISDFPFEDNILTLNPGESMLLYTDGVTEAEDKDHALLGEEAMTATLEECLHKGTDSPRDMVEALTHRVHAHTDGAVQSDDITIMCVEYKGKKEP